MKWSHDDRELASGGNDNQVWPFFPSLNFILLFRISFTDNLHLEWLFVLYEQLLVWNQHSQQPALRLTEHTAAVKAIAWSPHHSSLLASGGGTADRCIRFWNTTNGHQLNCVDTGSQVLFSSPFCRLRHFYLVGIQITSRPLTGGKFCRCATLLGVKM